MSEATLDHLAEGVGTADQDGVVDDVDPCHRDQEYQPEPDEHVELLVDDVDGQHAESVVGLDGAAGSVLLVQTLRHAGEDS